MRLVPLTLFALCTLARLSASVAISPFDDRIEVDGALIVRQDATDGLLFQRFTDDLLARKRQDGSTIFKSYYNEFKAKTSSGIVVRFSTASPTVQIHLREVPEDNRGHEVSILQNGAFIETINAGKNPGDYTVTATSIDPGNAVTYEICLPSWANVSLLGLTLEDGYDLQTLTTPDRPIFAAFGDSITHGTGQGSRTYSTYAFQIAQTKGWELYNFAIGGSTTTPEIATVLDDTLVDTWQSGKPDIITVLWGYNDRGNLSFTKADFQERYRSFVESLLAHCPDAKIFCITPIVTSTPEANDGSDNGKTIAEYRSMVADIVSSLNDEGHANVILIDGTTLVEVSDLQDGIHLTPNGAAHMATALIEAMTPTLNPQANFGNWRNQYNLPSATEASDSDMDGLPLLLEYLLNTNPTKCDPATIHRATITIAESTISLTFNALRGEWPDDLTILLQQSSDLGNTDPWTTVETVASNITPNGDGSWELAWSINQNFAQAHAQFLRLELLLN